MNTWMKKCKQTEWPRQQNKLKTQHRSWLLFATATTHHRHHIISYQTTHIHIYINVSIAWDEMGWDKMSVEKRKEPMVCVCVCTNAYECVCICGDIVFYKLRSKSEAAIEHNITIYLMAKYCKIYHLYIAPGPKTSYKQNRAENKRTKPSQSRMLDPVLYTFYTHECEQQQRQQQYKWRYDSRFVQFQEVYGISSWGRAHTMI